jgi:sugar lactone lactonase YvrE
MPDTDSIRVKVEIAVDTGDLCGENPIWDEATNRIYWTDQGGLRLHSFDPDVSEYKLVRSGLESMASASTNLAALSSPTLLDYGCGMV